MFSSLVTGKIMAGVSAVLLVILLAFGAYHYILVGALNSQITELTGKNASLLTENGVLTGANLKMSVTLGTQTAKITALVQEQKEASAKAEKAIASANVKATVVRAKYAALLAAPRESSNECEDIALRIDQFFKIRQTEDSR